MGILDAPAGLRSRGAWAATTNYAKNDIVTYNGGVYRATAAFTSGASFNPANWEQWAPQSGTYAPQLQPSGDATGAADTAAILALVAGSVPVELAAGTFYVNDRIDVTVALSTLVGQGDATVIVALAALGTKEVVRVTSAASGAWVGKFKVIAATSNNYAAVRVAAADVTVKPVTIVGQGAGSAGAQHGIFTDTTAVRCMIRRPKVSGIRSADSTYSSGAGVVVQGDDSIVTYPEVTDCSGVNNAAAYQQMGGIMALGVAGISGRRIKIVNGHSYSNGVHGLYATGCDHLSIAGGEYHDNGALATAASIFGRGITIGGNACVGVKVTRTALYNNQENGLIITGGSGGTGASDSSLVTNTTITGNVAYNNNLGGFAGGHGIEVNGYGGKIANNTCWGNHNGISVSGARQTITGNRCYANTSSDTTQGAGILLNFQVGAGSTVASVSTTNQSPTVTVASGGFPGVVPLQTVSGTGIPAGARVLAVSGNSMLLSANATATGTVTLTFGTDYAGWTVVGNECYLNDNYGVRALGTGNFVGAVINDNNLVFNGTQNRGGAAYDLLVSANCRSGTYRNNATNNSAVRISISDPFPNRGGNGTNSDLGNFRTLTYGASVTWAGESSELGLVTVTDGNTFTVSTPGQTFPGRRVTYSILNSSGGAMGAVTWSGFKMAGAWTNPANGTRRLITFVYDGSNWVEVSRSPADVS